MLRLVLTISFHFFFPPKDTWQSDEPTSAHVMIDVMNFSKSWDWNIKKCRQVTSTLRAKRSLLG